MNQGIEKTMYFDPQQEIPVCWCSRCGGARFAPSLRCIRCEEEADDT